MHADVVGMETPEGASADSDEVWYNTVYKIARLKRAAALVDLPDVPLFFGRLDYESNVLLDEESLQEDDEADDGRRVYIGRHHVHNAASLPLVIDWRAPISTPFYRASPSDPQGVVLRRRYGFSDTAELTAYEDEPLTRDISDIPEGDTPTSALLAAEIDGLAPGPMRDIVAAVQPEQDCLVRAPFTRRSASGRSWHRQDRRGTAPLGIPVIYRAGTVGRGCRHHRSQPVFLDLHPAGVASPRRGQRHPDHDRGSHGLAGNRPGRPSHRHRQGGRPDGERAAPRVVGAFGSPTDGVMIPRGADRYRLSADDIHKTAIALSETMRYGTGRTALAQRLAHLILVQMERRGASPDNRDQGLVARSKQIKQVVDQAWPRLTPEKVLFRLLSDGEFLAEAATGLLTEDEVSLLAWEKPCRSVKSAKWSASDVVLLDELADLIDRTETLSHIVVDEAQDLSPMQCRALGRRCRGVIDRPRGSRARHEPLGGRGLGDPCFGTFGKSDAHLAVLTQGFRAPAEIIDYAARLLPTLAPGLGTPTSVRRSPGSLTITPTHEEQLAEVVIAACRDRLLGAGSLGLIAADSDIIPIYHQLVETGLKPTCVGREESAMELPTVCVPASLAKGLKFDAVIVVEPQRIVEAETRGLHRLYVVLTRAVTSLHIIHAQPIPEALGQPIRVR